MLVFSETTFYLMSCTVSKCGAAAIKVILLMTLSLLCQNQRLNADLFVGTCNATKWERAVQHCGGRESFLTEHWCSGTHLKKKKSIYFFNYSILQRT